MALTITGDYLMRQYLGFTTQTDIQNGATPIGGLAKSWISGGNASSTTILPNQIGTTFLFDSAITYTLPAPGTIPLYSVIEFLWVSTATLTTKIVTDAATTFLVGGGVVDATATLTFAANGTTHRSINGNGTTTGGIQGSYAKFILLNSTQWAFYSTMLGSGTAANPLATS